jgi:hypothetical protein
MTQTITNTNQGNILTDGVYIDQITAPAPTPQGPQTGRVAGVGTANYGVDGEFVPFVNITGLGQAFGNNSTLPNALLADMPLCMPECQNLGAVRVTDGTDTAATIVVLDSIGATLGTLVNRLSGALPNPTTTASPNNGVGAYGTQALTGSTATGAPNETLSIVFPGYPTEQYTVPAYATAGAGYNAAAYIANLAAAVNGTGSGQAGSPRWTWVSGAGTHSPSNGVNFPASGGTNGANVTTAQLLGSNTAIGRTGMYALSGQIQAAQFFLCGSFDPSAAAAMAAFAAQENAIAVIGFQSLLPTTTEQAQIAANNMVNDNLILTSDWDSFYDPFALIQRNLAPMAKIAGIISSLPAYLYPGNEPPGGANGVIATDRIADPVVLSEAEQRQQSNILYLTNNPVLFPRATGYGIPFGTVSSGKLISDIRMLKTLSFQLGQAYGPLVGAMQGPLPTSGIDTDPFRIALLDATDGVLQPYLQAGQIVAYTPVDNSTNNTNATIQEGFAFISVAVTTKSAARFIVTFLQVGNTVQFQQPVAA